MGQTLRRVQDPAMSDSEFLYQQSQERERSRITGKAPNLNVGTVMVHENLSTRIGGLARIKARLQHHERAAEIFKSQYEALYGHGLGSTDAGRVQVDTSKTAHDSGMAASLDRADRLKQARVELGKLDFDLLVAVIVLHIPLGDFVEPGLSQFKHQKAVKEKSGEVLAALEALCEMWGIKTRS